MDSVKNSKNIKFQTHNVSTGKAVDIVKNHMQDITVPTKTRLLAIERVAYMETHNSITKDDLVRALRWLFDHYDFEE